MCYLPHARPPEIPAELLLPPMSGGAGGEEAILASRDGTKFRAYLAPAPAGDAGVGIAFLAAAEQPGLAGVVGFYGRLSKRDGETWPVPKEEAGRMRAPVLGLFGGDDPSIPSGDIGAFADALARARVKHHVETYP